jgi:hypothetical protein
VSSEAALMLFHSIISAMESRETALQVLLDDEKDRDAAIMTALTLAAGFCLFRRCPGGSRADFERGAALFAQQLNAYYPQLRDFAKQRGRIP